MKTLTSFRETLGISQRQLAAFIGGDRTQLVRAEKGERSLSASAAAGFAALLPAWQAAMQVPVDFPANIAAADAATFHWQALQCRHQAKTIQQELEALQQNFLTARRRLVFLDRMDTRQAALSERQRRWLEERRHEAQKIAGDETMAFKARTLELKIAALQAEALVYENALQERLSADR